MNDLKALTECAECTWDYIDRLRMALAATCKERDESRKELHEAKSELDAYRSTGVLPEGLNRAFNETAIIKLAAQALNTTPDHLRDIIKAEQDGRLVVLPCKVGDHVWADGREAIVVWFLGYKTERYLHAQFFDNAKHTDIPFYEIGKTVFLTREEAEAALALKGGDSSENRTDRR